MQKVNGCDLCLDFFLMDISKAIYEYRLKLECFLYIAQNIIYHNGTFLPLTVFIYSIFYAEWK